jgi:hypothetical protein
MVIQAAERSGERHHDDSPREPGGRRAGRPPSSWLTPQTRLVIVVHDGAQPAPTGEEPCFDVLLRLSRSSRCSSSPSCHRSHPFSSRPPGHDDPVGSAPLFLQVRGTTNREPGTAADQFRYVLAVYDMRNQKVGTVTHDLRLTSPTTGDLTRSFHLSHGDLVNRVEEVFAPDSTRPGFYLIGIHPDHDTLQADRNSGAYAGRTGRVRMSGWHDATRFPQTVALDDFWEITLTHP